MSVQFQNRNIPLDQLATSSANVRAVGRTKAVQKLAEDIAHQGLIQPLTVYKEGDVYRVDAGARRLAAIQLLASRGDWSDPVPCRVMPASTDTEMREAVSFSENHQQLPMHPLDAMRVISNFVSRGKDAKDVAARFGLDEKRVHQIMRLQRLALKIRKALADGSLSEKAALAYAETTDRARQAEAFSRFGNGHPAAIRRWILSAEGKVGGMTENHRLFQLVKDEYAEAGGQIGGDLFTPEGERPVDAALVRAIAEQNLREAADAYAKEHGLDWTETCINATRASDHPFWDGSEADCPVPMGVFAYVGAGGSILYDGPVVRQSDYDAWEKQERAKQEDAEAEDMAEAELARGHGDAETELAGVGGNEAEPDPETMKRAPSRGMDRMTEDALTLALQGAVSASPETAMDVYLFSCIVSSVAYTSRAPVSVGYASHSRDIPECVADLLGEPDGFHFTDDQIWKAIDQMMPAQKQQAFAFFIGQTMRANPDNHAIDRPKAVASALEVGARTGIDMRTAWDSEERRDYLNKMTKADLAETVLGLTGDDLAAALKEGKADLVERAHETDWLPPYLSGLTGPESPVLMLAAE